MNELMPYENYNPYPKIRNLSKEMYNAAQRVSLCSDRINKHYRCLNGFEDIDELAELVKMRDAAIGLIESGVTLLDVASAEIMRLSL